MWYFLKNVKIMFPRNTNKSGTCDRFRRYTIIDCPFEHTHCPEKNLYSYSSSFAMQNRALYVEIYPMSCYKRSRVLKFLRNCRNCIFDKVYKLWWKKLLPRRRTKFIVSVSRSWLSGGFRARLKMARFIAFHLIWTTELRNFAVCRERINYNYMA